MGWATITNNLGLGRYRIKVDSGESRRVALVNAANEGLAIVGQKLTASYQQVLLADQIEAESRAAIAALIDILVVENDPTAAGLAQRVLAIQQERYARLVASNQAVRQQYATLKDAQADLVRQRTAWESLQTITYKEAWCTDYTVNASTSSVNIYATIDIPGDPSLTLLAPGCRRFRQGDGNISSARKAAALSKRATELITAGERLASIEASLVAETAVEVALRAEVTAAQAAYTTTPTAENYTAFERKSAELNAKRREITNLQLSKQLVTVTIGRLNQEIAYWNGRAASETPYAGDGAMLAREMVSPAQAYFNAAIFPGWQKWMPTYRWGTASNVDELTNTMDVTLGPATSSAQRLNVNKESFLSRVPVSYMTCNAGAFEDGDRVVVAFANQSFESPTVIGFLDNPRECRAWPTTVVMDLVFENFPGDSPGSRQWANVTSWWEEGPAAGCSGANYSFTVTPYTARICEPAFHTFVLSRPEFADEADGDHFNLNVNDGSFSTLWTGYSSAWFFDTANRVPGGNGVANTFGLSNLAPGFIELYEQTTSAYTQSITYAHSFVSGEGSCTYIQPSTTGAWLHGGSNIEYVQPEVTTTYLLGTEGGVAADELLNSLGALPTEINVTRKRGGKTPKYYVLSGISQTDLPLPRSGRSWRFSYLREDA